MFDDLQGTLHAAAMLFVIVATAGVAFAYRNPPSRARALLTVGAIAVMTAAFFVLRGSAGSLGVGVLGAVACSFGGRRSGAVGTVLLTMATLGLMVWYGALIQRQYVGAGWTDARRESLNRSLVEYGARLTERAQDDRKLHLPGWLDETPFYDTYRLSVGPFEHTVTAERAQRLWHTWLTRLYAKATVRYSVHYPGGRVVEGAPRMSWRERP